MRIQGYNRTNTPKILEELDFTALLDAVISPPEGGAVYGYDKINITVPTEDITITENGTYTAPSTVAGYKTVVVNIPLDSITITENGHYTHPNNGGYNDITVDVQGGGSAVIQPLTVTTNGTYTVPSGVDGFNPIIVNITPNLQDKTITANGTYTADNGYDGLRQVVVDTPYAVKPSILVTVNDNTDIEIKVKDLNKLITIDDNTDITLYSPYVTHPDDEE